MSSPSPPAQANSPTAKKPAAVHPAALYLTRVLGPMSFKDQSAAHFWMTKIMYASSAVGWGTGFYLESFKATLAVVLGAALLCAVLFIPNWRQREDPPKEVSWVDSAKVKAYYDTLESQEYAIKRAEELEKIKKAAPAEEQAKAVKAEQPTEQEKQSTSDSEAKKEDDKVEEKPEEEDVYVAYKSVHLR